MWILLCFSKQELLQHGYKVSNIFSYPMDKYGEYSVKLLRFWEFTVKEMADHGITGDLHLHVLRWELPQWVAGSETT